MHNLALALHQKGFTVTGSDDEFFEPSKSRLEKAGLLPAEVGYFADRITPDLDAVILGMHATDDNPELKRARELGIAVYSFPEYLYEQTKNKLRIIVGGSHGKTTTTSMIMHVLRKLGRKFDYMVGAQIAGFETMVGLSEESDIAVFEGDEYLSSALDPTPKFHHYHPNVAIITGIAWDHINVFPTFENYVSQFQIYADKIERGGKLIYFADDETICNIVKNLRSDVEAIPYNCFDYVDDSIIYNGTRYPISIFGAHNLQNLNAAMLACEQVGVTADEFLTAIADFTGAQKRLEKVKETADAVGFFDFAHSPSKLQATVSAVADRYKNKRIFAVMELHTFSSLRKDFLPHYAHTLDRADEAVVYFNPEVIEHKRLEEITISDVEKGFEHRNLKVFTDSKELETYLSGQDYKNTALLISTSGNFSGIDVRDLIKRLI